MPWSNETFNLWRNGPLDGKARLSDNNITELNGRLSLCARFLTCTFPRNYRTLADVDRWKATEFRQFLLCLGPAVLRGVLHPDFHQNFVKLSVASYVLCSKKWLSYYLNHVKTMKPRFVNKIAALDGERELVLNACTTLFTCARTCSI